MARQLFIRLPGTVYHITNRVNAKQDIFMDNTVQKALLEVLAQIVERFNWLCHAYGLVDKHYNLSVETIDFTLSRGMRQINEGYAQFFNHRHKQTGHLF
ncbi:transposase [Peptococcaceae bacterium]|nr:transposase [Peptococcaceae bacterium]